MKCLRKRTIRVATPRVYKYEAPEVWQESVIDLPALSQKVASVNIRQEAKQDLIFMSTCLRSLCGGWSGAYEFARYIP